MARDWRRACSAAARSPSAYSALPSSLYARKCPWLIEMASLHKQHQAETNLHSFSQTQELSRT